MLKKSQKTGQKIRRPLRGRSAIVNDSTTLSRNGLAIVNSKVVLQYFFTEVRNLHPCPGLHGTTGHHLEPTQNDSEVIEETFCKNIPLDALLGNRGPKIQDHPSTSQQIVKTRKTEASLKIFRSCPASWEGKRCNQIQKWRSESGD